MVLRSPHRPAALRLRHALRLTACGQAWWSRWQGRRVDALPQRPAGEHGKGREGGLAPASWGPLGGFASPLFVTHAQRRVPHCARRQACAQPGLPQLVGLHPPATACGCRRRPFSGWDIDGASLPTPRPATARSERAAPPSAAAPWA